MKYDVIGIGSPLIDLTVKVEESILEKYEIQKGGMFLFDDDKLNSIYNEVKDQIIKTTPGDSTANTIVGASQFGCTTAYIGKVGSDTHGDFFIKSLTKNDVNSKIVSSKYPTGKVLCLITPDSERTMVVGLGAAKNIQPDDIKEEDIINSNILHLTGYQLEIPNVRETAIKAMDIAQENNVMISIDLADSHLVTRNLDSLKKIINEYATIVFANELEAEALTGMEPRESLDVIGDMCQVAIVKIGPEGSFIKRENCVYEIPAFKVKAVDTTGAGDMYAAGILYGIANEIPLDIAGKIGAKAASKVVSQMGARLDIDLKALAKKIK